MPFFVFFETSRRKNVTRLATSLLKQLFDAKGTMFPNRLQLNLGANFSHLFHNNIAVLVRLAGQLNGKIPHANYWEMKKHKKNYAVWQIMQDQLSQLQRKRIPHWRKNTHIWHLVNFYQDMVVLKMLTKSKIWTFLQTHITKIDAWL